MLPKGSIAMPKADEYIRDQIARYHSDDPDVRMKALEEILEDYKKFISHIINKHFASYKSKWYDDMYSVGVIGLMEGISKFDPDKSMPTTFFATYILHEIFDFIAEFVGHTTPYYARALNKLTKARAELESAGIDNPTAIDLSMKTGFKPEVVIKTLAIQTASQTLSYDSEEYFYSGRADPQMEPDEILIQNEGRRIIWDAVNALEPDLYDVVTRKCGLNGRKPQTNEEIARETGIAVNHVRHLYSKALDRLRGGEIYDFFAGLYRSEKRYAKERVSLVPIDTAERMISALLEFEGNDEEVLLD